jgi:hypothetical protein
VGEWTATDTCGIASSVKQALRITKALMHIKISGTIYISFTSIYYLQGLLFFRFFRCIVASCTDISLLFCESARKVAKVSCESELRYQSRGIVIFEHDRFYCHGVLQLPRCVVHLLICSVHSCGLVPRGKSIRVLLNQHRFPSRYDALQQLERLARLPICWGFCAVRLGSA